MNVTREAVATALLAQLALANGNGTLKLPNGTSVPQIPFKLFIREGIMWDKLSGQQPAAELIKVSEGWAQNALGLPKYVLHYWLLVYAKSQGLENTPDETFINQCLDAFDAAMAPKPPYQKQTLGNLVNNAWIEGDVMVDQGILDQQMAIVIPVKVETGS